MSKKFIDFIMCICFVMCVFFAAVSFSLALAIEAPSEKIQFKVIDAKRPVATINHLTHNKIECIYCHHTMKEGDVQIKKCNECHKKDKTEVLKFKSALHKNCKNCHKDLKKKKEKTGPTRCSKCHIK